MVQLCVARTYERTAGLSLFARGPNRSGTERSSDTGLAPQRSCFLITQSTCLVQTQLEAIWFSYITFFLAIIFAFAITIRCYFIRFWHFLTVQSITLVVFIVSLTSIISGLDMALWYIAWLLDTISVKLITFKSNSLCVSLAWCISFFSVAATEHHEEDNL